MDLSAAISKIGELAVGASGAKSVSVSVAHGRATIFDSKTGELNYTDVPQPPPDVVVTDMEDLVNVYSKYGDEDGTVWVAVDNVTALFDERRIGKAVLPLRLNPAIGVLKSLKDKTPVALRKLLRVDLFGLEIAPSDFVAIISNLKFEATQTNDVKLAKGDESIGKSIRSKVTAESEIPEDVSFVLSVYPDLAEVKTDVTIRCAVVTDATAGTVSVIPYPGEIERGIQSVSRGLASYLAAESNHWDVYCGTCKS